MSGDTLEKSLEKRLARLRSIMGLTLALVIASLIATGYAFYNAGAIIDEETKVPLNLLKSNITGISSSVATLKTSFEHAADVSKRIDETLVSTNDQIASLTGKGGELRNNIFEMRRRKNGTEQQISELSGYLVDEKAAIAYAQDERDSYKSIGESYRQDGDAQGAQRMDDVAKEWTLALTNEEQRNKLISERLDTVKGVLESYQRDVEEAEKKLNDNNSEIQRLKDQISTINKLAYNYEIDVTTSIASIDQLVKSVTANWSNVAEQTQTSSLVSTTLTRAGLVLMVIFMVQILVSLYRYNARLASFYEAQRDALILANERDQGNFEELVRLLSPDNLDFGKMVPSPAEHAVQLATEIIKRGKV